MRPAPDSRSSEQARFTTGIAGVLLIALLVGAAPTGPSSAGATGAPPGSHWLRNARDPRWVQGEIALAAAPTEVWGRIADVEQWQALFSDMASFSVDSRSPDGRRWVVRFESLAFGHGRHDYVATLDAARRSIRATLRR